MKTPARYTEIAAFVEATMPDATHEEKLEATFIFWRFFDAVWAIADRLVTEAEARGELDKTAAFDTLDSAPHV